MLTEKALTQTARSYVEVGKDLFQEGCFEEALSNFRKALDFRADNIEAHKRIAQIFARQKRWKDCALVYVKVLSLNPNEPVYLELGKALKCVGKVEHAISICHQAEQQNIVTPGLYRLLGDLMQEKKQHDQAASYYQKFLEMQPEASWGYVSLARSLQHLGQSHEVIQCCDQAIKRESVIPAIFRLKAKALQKLDKLSAAISCYRHFLDLEPENSLVYIELGELLLKQKRFDEVVDCCFQAKQQDSVHPVVYRLLGAAFQHQGLLDGSISNYQKFLELKPDVAWVYAALGRVWQRQGDLGQAVACFMEADQRGHNQLQMNQLIADIYKSQNQLDEAVPFYQRVMELKSATPEKKPIIIHGVRSDLAPSASEQLTISK